MRKFIDVSDYVTKGLPLPKTGVNIKENYLSPITWKFWKWCEVVKADKPKRDKPC